MTSADPALALGPGQDLGCGVANIGHPQPAQGAGRPGQRPARRGHRDRAGTVGRAHGVDRLASAQRAALAAGKRLKLTVRVSRLRTGDRDDASEDLVRHVLVRRALTISR